MDRPATPPIFPVTTWRARGKARFAMIKDDGVLGLMRAVGRPLIGAARMETTAGSPCLGIFALPSGHVVEFYEAAGKRTVISDMGSPDAGASIPSEDLEKTSSPGDDRPVQRPGMGYVFANLDAWLNHAHSEDL